MWRNTPAPGDLREEFPDVSFTMETEFVSQSLRQLGIQFIRRFKKRSAVIEVAMHPHHLLRISPVDKGSDGYAEWFTWYWSNDSESGEPILKSSVRAHLEIVDLQADDDSSNVSFTSHQDDIESLVQNAILGMRHVTGQKVKPVVIKKRAA